MAPASPLGIFDSGLGGLTVVRAIREALPNERIVYLGDTARVPYGTRSAETIVRYARGCARVLTERGVKALVVACNTVSAVALEMLRVEFDLPVLGVVEPGARAALDALSLSAASSGREAKIGVLGTLGTIASGAYVRAIGRLATRAEVVAIAAPLLVPLVEEGWTEGEVPRLAVRRYVAPLVDAGARVFLLGCTHYPLLAPLVREVASELAGCEVFVVDGAQATARELTQWIAEERVLGAPPRQSGDDDDDALELLVTDLPASFADMASRFLGASTPRVRQVDLG